MIKNKEIKKLLLKGFDKKLIAFELDLPFEDVEKLSLEIEQSEKSLKELSTRKKLKADLKRLREKYNNVYFETNLENRYTFEEVSYEEKLLINRTFEVVKELAEKVPEDNEENKLHINKYEKIRTVKALMKEINKILKYPLSLEVAEELYYMFELPKLKNFSIFDIDIARYLEKLKRAVALRFSQAIEAAYVKTDNINELTMLKSKITLNILNENRILFSAINMKILDKITKLKQQQLKNDALKRIPSEIDDIIEDIKSGKLDLQKANNSIEEAIKNSITKNKEILSEENERKIYMIYIADSLMKEAYKHYIEDPMAAVLKLKDLASSGIGKAAKIVTTNLTERKEYQRAKSLIEEMIFYERDEEEYKTLKYLKKDIERKEIAERLLGILKNFDEDEKYLEEFEKIKLLIETGKIQPKEIMLGRKQDQTRNITLAEIWVKSAEIEL